MKFPELLKSVEKVDDDCIRITLDIKRIRLSWLVLVWILFLFIPAEYADAMLKAGKPETLG